MFLYIILNILLFNVIKVNCSNNGCVMNLYNRAEGLCQTISDSKTIKKDELWTIITFLPYADGEQFCNSQLINVGLTASQVQVINMHNININNINNNCFRGMNNLKTIKLSNNKLTTIDYENLSHARNTLENVTLSYNRLNKFDFQTSDFVFKSLKELNLQSNRLKVIVIKRNNYPSIMKINLSENQLSMVVIESNTITTLDLSDTLITDLSTKSLNSLQVPYLEELNLSNCLLTALYGELFEGMRQLKFLNVAGNPIVEIFPFDHPTLKVINHQKTAIRDFIGLSDLRVLENVDLSDNYIYELRFELSDTLVAFKCNHCRLHKVLTNSIITFYQKLLVLDLSWNYLEDIDIFQSTYADSSPLATINLSHNQIRFLQHNGFEKLTALEELDLSYNNIVLLHNDALAGMHNLKSLDLSSNSIFQINQEVLQPLISLEILKINANKLSYFPTPARSSKVLKKLKSFVFYGNPLQCSCENEIYQWTTNNNILLHISDLRKDGKKPICIVAGEQCDPNMNTNVINDVSYHCGYLWSD